jgi:hypothetical protein
MTVTYLLQCNPQLLVKNSFLWNEHLLS